MSEDGYKVVFLIHPNFASEKHKGKKQWEEVVFGAIVRILTYFDNIPLFPCTWDMKCRKVIKPDSRLKWGYTFASKYYATNMHEMNDFRSFNYTALDMLMQEIKCNSDCNSHVGFTSHVLADNLTAMANDFNWEQYEIVSPVKPLRKKLNKVESRSSFGRKRGFDGFNNLPQNNNLGKNFVFVIGPVPISRSQLDDYFEWHVETVDEIENILMPVHLAQHFRDKHNIGIFWIDTSELYFENKNEDNEGLLMMEKFLKSNKGCVIPLSLLGICSETWPSFLKRDSRKEKLSDENCNKPQSYDTNDNVFEEACTTSTINHRMPNWTWSYNIFPVSYVMSYFLNKAVLPKLCTDKNTLLGFLIFSYTSGEEIVERKITIHIESSISATLTHCKLFCEAQKETYFKQVNKTTTSPLTKKIWLQCSNKETCSVKESSVTTLEMVSTNFANCSNKPLCFENSTSCTTLHLHVVGEIPTSSIPLQCLHSTNLIYVPKNSAQDFGQLTASLHQRKTALVVENNCPFCGNPTPVLKDCSFLHQYGLLQLFSDKTGSVTWLSDLHKRNIIQLLGMCCSDDNLANSDAVKFINQALKSYKDSYEQSENNHEDDFSVKPDYASEPDLQPGALTDFQPYMLESWYVPKATSGAFHDICDNVERCTSVPVPVQNFEIEFNNALSSELQQIYNAELLTSRRDVDQLTIEEVNTPATLPSCVKLDENFRTDFSSWEDLHKFISAEYNDCLQQDIQPTMIKQKAYSIIQSVCAFIKTQEHNNFLNHVSKILSSEVFLTAASIHQKNELSEKQSLEFMLQVLLRMEWLCYKMPLCNNNSEILMPEVDVISQLLLAFSSSEDVVKMKEFIQDVLIKFYLSSCGKLLHDIHDGFNIPLPETLQEFSADIGISDILFDPMSCATYDEPPSTGPFSTLSSVGSRESTDSQSGSRPKQSRRTSHLAPMVTRQIAVPAVIKKSEKSGLRSKSMKPVKLSPLKSYASNHKQIGSRNTKKSNESGFENVENPVKCKVAEGIVRVRRDLFASPSKSTRSRTRLSEPEPLRKEERSRRKTSVVDTPTAKQRLTALTRQRIRLRRSEQHKDDVDELHNTSVVEESPIKPEDDIGKVFSNQVPNKVKRSPRHSIMLTRRHSFYRDDTSVQSRTVSRAQVIHQHKEAAPQTPATISSLCVTKEKPGKEAIVSPRSLLFSYTASSRYTQSLAGVGDVKQPYKLTRSRRKLQLVDKCQPNVESQSPTNTRHGKPHSPKNDCVDVCSALESKNDKLHITLQSTLGVDMESSSRHNNNYITSNDSYMKTQTLPIPNKEPNPIKSQDTQQGFLPFTTYHDDSSPADRTKYANAETSISCDNPCDADISVQPSLSKTLIGQTDGHEQVLASSSRLYELKADDQQLVHRSPRLSYLQEIQKSPPVIKSLGPLYKYVIRTPPSIHKVRQPQTTTSTAQTKRKPSPDGDHIQRWPRKKRVVEKLFPSKVKVNYKSEDPSVSSRLPEVLSNNLDIPQVDNMLNETKSIRLLGDNSDLSISPGVEVANLLPGVTSTVPEVRSSIKKTPRKKFGSDMLDEMGVYPLETESMPSSAFRRWTSPRRRVKPTVCKRLSISSPSIPFPSLSLEETAAEVYNS